MPRRRTSRRRLLAIGKWAGLVLSVVIAGAWFTAIAALWRDGHSLVELVFLYVLPLPLMAALPALVLLLSRRPRPLPGHCRCGYNLAGLDGKVCPECGLADPEP